MLDVHVIILPGRDRKIVQQCLDSIFTAVDRAHFQVNVHTLEGVEGHIGWGRKWGYGHGSAEYVTCVDDDDLVMSNAFNQMEPALSSGRYLAVSTPEKIERNGYVLDGKQRHHLIAYRRDQIIDHSPWACCGDLKQILSIPEYGWHDLESPGYLHRVYESPARLMRRANQDELLRALDNG